MNVIYHNRPPINRLMVADEKKALYTKNNLIDLRTDTNSILLIIILINWSYVRSFRVNQI